MRAPDFWRADGTASRLLSPLGHLYGALGKRSLARDAPRGALPTIVVGGPTSGGDGKTPVVIALAEALKARGERPALLTRGYGRSRRRPTPFLVSQSDDVTTAGDEALLLSRCALAIVGADRAASARLAHDLGASVLILDDGFHSRRLAADFSLLVIDSDYGAGNGRCLPAGPLRAPLPAQFQAADAALVVGDGAAGRQLEAQCAKPVFHARITPFPLEQFASGPVVPGGLKARQGIQRDESADSPPASLALRESEPTTNQSSGRRVVLENTLAGARVIGFAGIGRPEKFFRTLAEAGAKIVATRAFPDHHRFNAREIDELAALGRRFGAKLVTTEKDAARLPPGVDFDCDTLPIGLVFQEPGLMEALVAALDRARLSRAS